MWQCNGDLDVAALQRAYQRCIDRHESLRTTFAVVDKKLRQIVLEHLEIALPVTDLSTLDNEERRVAADRITREHASFAFDLEQGPLITLHLLKLGAKDHILLVTMHHIICDGISLGILLRDLFALYESELTGREASLPELPVQYADYSLWHEGWMQGEESEQALSFWRERIGTDFLPVSLEHEAEAASELPAHLAGSTGAIETQLVPGDIVARERTFCQAEGITQNVFFFASFLAWLARVSGQTDLMVGYPVANRTEDTQDLIGLFINIQPIRVKITPQMTFRELLHFVQQWTIEASEYQALPFETLAQHKDFSDSRTALQLPVFFLYQPSFMQVTRIETPASSLQVIPLRSESPGAIFEMMMAVVDRAEEGPRLQLEYNPQNLRASTMRSFLGMLVSILDGSILLPDAPVLLLPLVSGAERRDLLNRFVGEPIDFGAFESVQSSVLRRAASNPNQIAIECANGSLSYAQLQKRAFAIATRLQQEGVVPGDRVAVCMGRSTDTVATLLAILLAGASYVPLDSRYPAARIETAVEDSEARLLVTDRELHLQDAVRILNLASVSDAPASAFTPQPCSPDDIAYVIYTSGSTGKPKGVAVPHGALRNLLLGVQRKPGLTAQDVWCAITTISFDIAALEIFLPLVVGARLVFATENEARTPTLLLSLLKKTKTTVLQATPGAWRALIDEGWTKETKLRVLCGGEALSTDLANRLLDCSDSVWNMYGPTETTIWSSATRVQRGLSSPPVSDVLPNQQFYVLDDSLEPVPFGRRGELCIAGAGVAAGYWNRPEQTSDRFKQNPFGPGRIYRTGDAARIDADGTLRLMGRMDFQVKVRGYRIELGEIESVLEQHAHVREALVVQHVLKDDEERVGVTRLIAYVDAPLHADDDKAPQLVRELEATIGASLPEYMMPNAIVALPELPRLINGKVDRKALPDVFDAAGNAGVRISASDVSSFQAPRDFLERQLTDIWQATLGIPRISTAASFFSLAVGSLAAMRLVTKMNRIFAVDFGLATLVSSPTIQDIAELIRRQHDAGVVSSLVPIRKEGSKPPLFILHGVGGNVISFMGLSRRLGEDQPVYGIQSQALLQNQSALLRLEDMAAFYIREIKTVQPKGPYYLLGYSFGGTVAAEMSEQLRDAGEEVAYLSMLDSKTKHFEERFRNSMPTQAKFDRRFRQIRGNTMHLSMSAQVKYITSKLATRAARFTARALVSLGSRRMPSSLKVAWDVNHVAMQRYQQHPYRGKLILFRATDQDYASGPRDLGWNEYFPEGVEIHEIRGDHERIFLEPAVDDMAAAIVKTLQKVQR